jgi:hypothetical protein
MSENNNSRSFYIPAIGGFTQQEIVCVFRNNIGEVERVDYFQNASGTWCAFVHFIELYDNDEVQLILDEIDRYGSYRFWFSSVEYLILKKMNCKKIPETHLNIHQIAEKLEKLEEPDERILNLENRILKLEEIILKQNKEIVEQQMFREDAEMEQMVTSLVGPRWTQDDEVDATSPIFVSYNESKVDNDSSSIFETR